MCCVKGEKKKDRDCRNDGYGDQINENLGVVLISQYLAHAFCTRSKRSSSYNTTLQVKAYYPLFNRISECMMYKFNGSSSALKLCDWLNTESSNPYKGFEPSSLFCVSIFFPHMTAGIILKLLQ